MSWQDYVTNNLMVELPHGGSLQSAAIVGKDGGVWAVSEEFPAITSEQIALIVAGLDNPDSALDRLYTEGLFIGDQKFRLVMGDKDEFIIRAAFDAGGLCIKGASTCFVVGIYKKPVVASDCNQVIEKMGEYFSEIGY